MIQGFWLCKNDGAMFIFERCTLSTHRLESRSPRSAIPGTVFASPHSGRITAFLSAVHKVGGHRSLVRGTRLFDSFVQIRPHSGPFLMAGAPRAFLDSNRVARRAGPGLGSKGCVGGGTNAGGLGLGGLSRVCGEWGGRLSGHNDARRSESESRS